MNNKKDNECFKCAITRALNPVDHNKGNISKLLREQSKELNGDGIEFPTLNSEKVYKKFEKNNTIRLNVFGHDNNKIIPLYVLPERYERVVRILFIKNTKKIVIDYGIH